MILFGELETAERLKVNAINHTSDTIPLDAKQTVLKVDTLPAKEILYGKRAVTYANPKTGEIWYEYVDRPLTQEEVIGDLVATNRDISAKLDSIILKLGIATAEKV